MRGTLSAVLLATVAAATVPAQAQTPQPPSEDLLDRIDTALAQVRHAQYPQASRSWRALEPEILALTDPAQLAYFSANGMFAACQAGDPDQRDRWQATLAGQRDEDRRQANLALSALNINYQRMLLSSGRDAYHATDDSGLRPRGEGYDANGRLLDLNGNGRLDDGRYVDSRMQVHKQQATRSLAGFGRQAQTGQRPDPVLGWSGPSCSHGTSALALPKTLTVNRRRGATITLKCTWVQRCRGRVLLRPKRRSNDPVGLPKPVLQGTIDIPGGATRKVTLKVLKGATSRLRASSYFLEVYRPGERFYTALRTQRIRTTR